MNKRTLKIVFAIVLPFIIAATVIFVALQHHPHGTTATTTAASSSIPKTFGVVGSPNELKKWAQKTGTNPTMPMEFEAWSKNRTLDTHFADAVQNGYHSYMITWEPWQPVPATLGLGAQSAIQPAYSNAAIAAGQQDEYINRFAQSVAKSGLKTVYIRYAHEMNGDWYPWSQDSTSYIKAWQHIVTLFRAAGATNAKFVYATNPSLYKNDADWTKGFWQYWPGNNYVDYVGSTMINFGTSPCSALPCPLSTKGYSVALFKQRISESYALTGKEMIISEMNTALQGDTASWLQSVTDWVSSKDSHIHGVVLSQQPSRGSAQMKTGNLSWNISDEPTLYPVLKKLMAATTK